MTTAELTRQQIEALPGYRKKTATEYCSACPFCGTGDDRFIFWPDRGNYWCRVCDQKGFISDNGNGHWSPADRERYMAEAAARAEAEREAKAAAVDSMASQVATAEGYHRKMTDRSYWYSQGLTDDTINQWWLGYCMTCPTCPTSPSHTIPIFFRDKLLNIRHRLACPPAPGDKYRPHRAGLPAVIFNAALLLTELPHVVLVEGEVKAMVLTQYGFPAVGIPGANIFPDRWVKWFARQPTVYVTLDPGAEGHARDIALMLGDRARLVSLPVKPDDFFVIYGGTDGQFETFLKQGRKIK